MRTRSNNLFSFLRVLTFAVVSVLVFWCCLPASAQSLQESDSSQVRISIPEAAHRLDVSTAWKPDEWKLTLTHESGRADILIGSDRLIVKEQVITLSAPVKAEKGTVTMMLPDAVELFTRLLGRSVTRDEIEPDNSARRQPPTRTTDRTTIRNVRYISYPRFTRIIINISADRSSEDIDVSLAEEANVLTVELPNAYFAQSAKSINVDDKIVDRIKQVRASSGARLVVRTVPDEIKYEVQKHDDPPRIVVDVSSTSPQIATNFLSTHDLPPKRDPWTEPEPIAPREETSLTTIVIDPGHGGKDNGARGRGGLYEKDVTLGIARKLKKLIEEKPAMKAILTRTGDYFVPLKERTAIANHAKDGMPADLFISIHTNAHKSQRVGGFECFYISDVVDPDAEATAALENAALEFEVDTSDPLQAALTPILWDLQFTEFVTQSSEFASLAQQELAKNLSTRNRGVRQANFIVLAGVAMPSILVEVGFISNGIEEAKLKTNDFRAKCAAALADAVASFKQRHDVRLGLLREESEH